MEQDSDADPAVQRILRLDDSSTDEASSSDERSDIAETRAKADEDRKKALAAIRSVHSFNLAKKKVRSNKPKMETQVITFCLFIPFIYTPNKYIHRIILLTHYS